MFPAKILNGSRATLLPHDSTVGLLDLPIAGLPNCSLAPSRLTCTPSPLPQYTHRLKRGENNKQQPTRMSINNENLDGLLRGKSVLAGALGVSHSRSPSKKLMREAFLREEATEILASSRRTNLPASTCFMS